MHTHILRTNFHFFHDLLQNHSFQEETNNLLEWLCDSFEILKKVKIISSLDPNKKYTTLVTISYEYENHLLLEEQGLKTHSVSRVLEILLSRKEITFLINQEQLSEKNWEVETLLEHCSALSRVLSIKKQIDEALDRKDEEAFFRLTSQLHELESKKEEAI